jgi:hypothetical protein
MESIMARETANERRARQQLAAEAALAAELEFRETVPALMFRLKVLAQKVSVRTELNVTEEGFVMTFTFENAEEVLNTFDTEQWEAEHLERMLNELAEQQAARVRRRELAQQALAKLDPAELAALKEFRLMA